MEQTEYEKSKGLKSRKELTPLFIEMISELDECDFHNFYALIWSATAKDLLYKIAKKDLKKAEKVI